VDAPRHRGRRLAPQLRGPDDDGVAGRQADPIALPGGELDDRLRTPAGCQPPGLQVPYDAEDAAVGIQEGRVDREAHEPHVNGGSGTKQDSLAPLEPGPAEEAASTSERCLREETPLTHQAAVLSFQGYEHVLG
jgi:hypothetical protein